jgi:hypothetical protein
MAHQGASVDIPDGGNLVTVEIELSRLCRAPVGGNRGELANDERLNVGAGGFFIIEIGADVADVGISKANNLSEITGICEDFLVTGKAGIENNLAAATRDGAGRAAVKYAPVFERENGRSVKNFCQCILRATSFLICLSRGQGTEVVHRPVSEHGATVDILAGHRPKHA